MIPKLKHAHKMACLNLVNSIVRGKKVLLRRDL